ncbi:hypothetical protein [Moraxella lacunata]|uniref:hypothetical protein n=1 Tax=Moraxella lacunata TaxID=477 RepID=UPI003EE3E277
MGCSPVCSFCGAKSCWCWVVINNLDVMMLIIIAGLANVVRFLKCLFKKILNPNLNLYK